MTYDEIQIKLRHARVFQNAHSRAIEELTDIVAELVERVVSKSEVDVCPVCGHKSEVKSDPIPSDQIDDGATLFDALPY